MAMDVQLAEHPLMSPKAEPKPEKKPGQRPQSHGEDGPQKELVIPGIVDFELIREALRTPKAQTPGTYRFGRLSHHSFFSRHHPHSQRVTHIPDLTGKPVCVVRDEFSLGPLPQSTLLSSCLMGVPTISVPIGDPQSNRNPQLSSETWKRELKELASRVAFFTKENEQQKNKEQKEETLREQGAKYSAETGRLIPPSTRVGGCRSSRQGQRSQPSSRDGGVQAILQDQELLILELLCQILQTDSLSAIQFWLLYAPPKEKDLALGLLQTAVAQFLPQPLASIPAERLLHQLEEVQESPQENQQLPYSQSPKKMRTPPVAKSEKPEYIGKAQVLRMPSSQDMEEKTSKPMAES
ncbi:PREDICTED: protein TBATA [Propithecus coquereli]|uniref:Thymus, brain and testes associated n=1 Tax=Propithecus coquereli TaxID=379532 RepID=A0A2K6EW27_PROCO|nr:PREDICTED: protein TBATA [Propithecus coquereli]